MIKKYNLLIRIRHLFIIVKPLSYNVVRIKNENSNEFRQISKCFHIKVIFIKDIIKVCFSTLFEVFPTFSFGKCFRFSLYLKNNWVSGEGEGGRERGGEGEREGERERGREGEGEREMKHFTHLMWVLLISQKTTKESKPTFSFYWNIESLYFNFPENTWH